MTPDEQRELLVRFAPKLHFDALERWRPSLADDYMRRSTLLDGDEHPVGDTPPAVEAMVEQIGDLKARLNPLADGPGTDTQLRGNELLRAYGGDQDLGRPGTCYGRVVEGRRATFLQYWLFYADNPCVLPPGRHDGDWELVQIRLAPAGKGFKATQVTLAEHGKPVTHPIDSAEGGFDVFVAVDSHACYFEAGAHPMFPLSDVCDPAGAPGAVPGVVPLPIAETKEDWVHWSGRWGMDRGPGTWLALQLHLKRTPSFMRRLNKIGAGDSPSSPAGQGTSWRFPRAFAARGTQRRWTNVELQRLIHFIGHLTWPREAPRVSVARAAPGSYTIEARPAGRFVRRVTMVSVAFEEERPDGARRPLAMHSVRAGRTSGPFEIEHDGPLRWHAAGYNFLRQRGDPVQ